MRAKPRNATLPPAATLRWGRTFVRLGKLAPARHFFLTARRVRQGDLRRSRGVLCSKKEEYLWKKGLIFGFRHGIVFASPPSGCYLKSDSIQQMLRKPASFNAFARTTDELFPGGLCPHILPDASSSLHGFSGFWLDLRSSVRQRSSVRLFLLPVHRPPC